MRTKVAKRIRSELRRRGCVIKRERAIRGPGWKTSDCGYSILYIDPNGEECLTLGQDVLGAYKTALRGLDEKPDAEPIPIQLNEEEKASADVNFFTNLKLARGVSGK